MSNVITNLCRPVQVSPAQKAVLMALADRADDVGIAWPSYTYLSQWTCLGRSTVIRAIASLEALGIVAVERSDGQRSRHAINVEVLKAQANPSRIGTPTRPVAVPMIEEEMPINPSHSDTRPDAGPVPERDPHPSRSDTPPVPDRDGTRPAAGPNTSIDINKTSVKTKRARESALAIPDVPQLLLADYLAVRKAKKAGPLTDTALAGLRREAAKAGISLDAAITVCCERSWTGFKAEWFKRESGAVAAGATNDPTAVEANCPHDDLVDLYSQHLPTHTQPVKSLWRSGENGAALAERWHWLLTAIREDGERAGERYAMTREEGLAWFGKYFALAAESDWLCGRTGRGNGWRCNLPWLMKRDNFEKVYSGDYENTEAVNA